MGANRFWVEEQGIGHIRHRTSIAQQDHRADTVGFTYIAPGGGPHGVLR
jgi:hypothetical protein